MKYISIFLLIFLAACGTSEDTTSAVQPVKNAAAQAQPVEVRTIVPSTQPVAIPATGIVASSSEIKLSFKVPGIVSAIYVEEGQKVRKGQILARINPTEINAQVKQADIALEKALRDLKRAEALYADTVITLEQLQNTRTARDAAAAQRDIAAYNRANAVITSNVNGRVLRKFAEKGELVGAGVPVLYVASGKGQQVIRTSLADRDVIKVALGDPAKLRFDAWPGEQFEARVSEIAATADPRTGAFDVELLIQQGDKAIMNGFVGKLDLFPKNQTPYLAIPIDAIVDADDNMIAVFLADKNNVATRRQWQHYELTDGYALVMSKDTSLPLIVKGARRLSNGTAIQRMEVQASRD